jgi:hypothetical protein
MLSVQGIGEILADVALRATSERYPPLDGFTINLLQTTSNLLHQAPLHVGIEHT